MTKSITLAMLALLLLSPAASAGSDAEAIAAASLAWEKAYNAGNGTEVAALYSADAALLPPGGAQVAGR